MEPTVPWIGILYKFNEKNSGTPKNSRKEMGSLFFFGHFKNVQFSKPGGKCWQKSHFTR
jgi:hypothetical protein